MPIVYEQPQPFREEVSRDAGAADTIIRMAPVLQRADEARAASFARQSEAGQQFASQNADRASKAAMFVYGQEAEAGQQDADRMQRAQVANAQMQHQAQMQQAQAQAEENQMRLRFQSQMELQQTELSHREQVDLQRMKLAVGSIQSNENLTPEEKADLTTQLHTKISPMEQRMARARMAQEEIETDILRKKSAQASSIAQMDAAYFAKGAQATMGVVKDPQTGEPIGYNVYQPGKGWHFEKAESASVKNQMREEARIRTEELHQQRIFKAGEEASKQWMTANEHAHKVADRELEAVTKEWEARMAKAKPGEVVEQKPFNYGQRVKELMGDLPATPTEARARATAMFSKVPGSPGDAGSQMRPGGPAPDPSQKPFDKNKPETQTVEQKAILEKVRAPIAEVRSLMSKMGGSGIPQEQLEAALQSGNDALDLIQQHGSLAAMRTAAPTDFAKFEAGMQRMSDAIVKARAAQEQRKPDPQRHGKREDERGNLVTDPEVPFGVIRKRDGQLIRVLNR